MRVGPSPEALGGIGEGEATAGAREARGHALEPRDGRTGREDDGAGAHLREPLRQRHHLALVAHGGHDVRAADVEVVHRGAVADPDERRGGAVLDLAEVRDQGDLLALASGEGAGEDRLAVARGGVAHRDEAALVQHEGLEVAVHVVVLVRRPCPSA